MRRLLSFTEFYRVFFSGAPLFFWASIGLCEFLPSFTEFYSLLGRGVAMRRLPSFTEFYRVLPSFVLFLATMKCLPSFTEFFFYEVLLDSTLFWGSICL